MNGTGPPDRAQSLGSSTLQGRTQTQTPCPVFSCENPKLACRSMVARHIVARPSSSARDYLMRGQGTEDHVR